MQYFKFDNDLAIIKTYVTLEDLKDDNKLYDNELLKYLDNRNNQLPDGSYLVSEDYMSDLLRKERAISSAEKASQLMDLKLANADLTEQVTELSQEGEEVQNELQTTVTTLETTQDKLKEATTKVGQLNSALKSEQAHGATQEESLKRFEQNRRSLFVITSLLPKVETMAARTDALTLTLTDMAGDLTDD